MHSRGSYKTAYDAGCALLLINLRDYSLLLVLPVLFVYSVTFFPFLFFLDPNFHLRPGMAVEPACLSSPD